MDLTVINTIRTNNFNDEQIMKKITRMWEGVSADLSQHEGNVYGLYYAYESDYKGDYTLSVAIEGKSESSITISEDTTYEIFKVDTETDQGILNTWYEIWNKEEEGQLNRAYTYDFEKYYPNGNIDIHIAVK